MHSIRGDNLLEIFKNYIRQLNFGQIILGISIFGLSIWCGYNVAIIFNKFLDHETIISLENLPPSTTDFPGITICAPSIIKPQVLAHYYPEFAKEFYKYDYDKRNSKDDHFDTAQNLTEIRHKLLRKFESKALSDFPAEQIIKNISVRLDDILLDCVYNPINIRNFQISKIENKNFAIKSKKCTDIKNMTETIFEYRKCFTFFSQLEPKKPQNKTDYVENNLDTSGDGCKPPHFCEVKPHWSDEFKQLLNETSNEMIYDLNPSIEITLKSVENDIWHAYVIDKTLATVHPANSMINRRESVFFQVARSNYYEVAFTQKTTQLLEPPSNTMCVVYQNDPYFVANQIRTRDQCMNRCINMYKANETTCANYYSMITIRMVSENGGHRKICDHEHQSYDAFLEARNACEKSKKCPAECKTYIFEVTGQLRSQVNENCLNWKDLPSTITTQYDIADLRKRIEFDAASDLTEEEDTDVAETTHIINSNNNSIYQVDARLLGANYSLVNPSFLGNYLPLYKWGMSVGSIAAVESDADATDSDSDTNLDLQVGGYKTVRCNARVLIRISPKPFTLERHQMAMSMEGFLGSIGGHIGVWLGLSLYKIIKVLVHILYSLLTKTVHRLSPGLLAQSGQIRASSNHGHQQ